MKLSVNWKKLIRKLLNEVECQLKEARKSCQIKLSVSRKKLSDVVSWNKLVQSCHISGQMLMVRIVMLLRLRKLSPTHLIFPLTKESHGKKRVCLNNEITNETSGTPRE